MLVSKVRKTFHEAQAEVNKLVAFIYYFCPYELACSSSTVFAVKCDTPLQREEK